MTISLQSTFPPGYIPPGVDPKALDPAAQKMMETTGITLGVALKLIGLDLNDVQGSRMDSLLKSLLPAPGSEKPGGSAPLSKLTPQGVEIDIYSVMALFQQCAQQMRDNAREVRSAETQAQVKSLMGAAQEIRNAAEDRFAASVTQGAMQIAGGAVSVGMGVAGGVFSAKGINTGADTVAGAKLNNIGATLSATAQGTGNMVSGTGTIAAAFAEQNAAEHDASKAELEADARVHEQGAQHANDLMQQMMDVIRDVREKLGAIDQARTETVRGIARNV